jgi:COP9 signalosome complex subunit 1
MDVEGEMPAAAAAAVVNGLGEEEAAPAPFFAEQLDVEAYTAQYSGRTRLARLIFIADVCGVEAMQLDALRMAYDEIKKGEDTQLHRDVALKIKGRLGSRYGLDQAWADTVNRRADQRKEKLDTDLDGYRVRKPYTCRFPIFRLIRLSHCESVDTSVCSSWIRVPRNYWFLLNCC